MKIDSLIIDNDTGCRRIKGGINWIWFITDNRKDAARWFNQLTKQEDENYELGDYEWLVCDMGNNEYGFRIHRDAIPELLEKYEAWEREQNEKLHWSNRSE